MNHPSKEISKHISFYKKAIKRLTGKGAVMLEIEITSNREQGSEGQGGMMLSGKASNMKYDAVIVEAKNICQDYQALPERVACDLRETAEYDDRRHFALKLVLGGHDFDRFPEILTEWHELPISSKAIVMEHPSKDIRDCMTCYKEVVKRLADKGADIKDARAWCSIKAGSTSTVDFMGFGFETNVVNVKYDGFLKEFQAIEQKYNSFDLGGGEFSRQRSSSDSGSRTDWISFSQFKTQAEDRPS